MKTTQDNMLNVMYGNHRILIDKLIEYDYNGDMAVAKKMCHVIRYGYDDEANDETTCETATHMIFNISPYTSLMDMDIMVKVWIDCGCPSDNGRKWTKVSLQEWA